MKSKKMPIVAMKQRRSRLRKTCSPLSGSALQNRNTPVQFLTRIHISWMAEAAISLPSLNAAIRAVLDLTDRQFKNRIPPASHLSPLPYTTPSVTLVQSTLKDGIGIIGARRSTKGARSQKRFRPTPLSSAARRGGAISVPFCSHDQKNAPSTRGGFLAFLLPSGWLPRLAAGVLYHCRIAS